MVASRGALEALAERVAAAELIAVDTEFVREKTYYPQLCLLQIAALDMVAAVDCRADLDLSPLLAALFRPGATWLLHSARQDLEVLWQRTERMPPELIDTQIAAAFVGFAPQLGLEDLLARALGVELGESYARMDWSQRPLPEAAFRYALDDVRYLEPAWAHLRARLEELGRLDWVREDCARLLAERPVADATAIFSRLRAVQGLRAESQQAALALVHWREQTAQRVDRPRRWILADDVLIGIAAALPTTRADLETLLAPRFAEKNGEAILAAVAQRSDPELVALAAAHNSGRVPDRKQLKDLQEAVKRRAATLGIEPEILATRRDLSAIVLGCAPLHLRQGWRSEQLALLGV